MNEPMVAASGIDTTNCEIRIWEKDGQWNAMVDYKKSVAYRTLQAKSENKPRLEILKRQGLEIAGQHWYRMALSVRRNGFRFV